MKKFLSLLIPVLLLTATSYSQAPGIFNYQGVARNSVGNVLQNKNITLRISIHDGVPTGTIVYAETRNVTTNPFGLFNVQVGSPGASSVTGSITGTNWALGNKFVQVEIDPAGGSLFINIGTVQLASVPYALNAMGAAPIGPAGGDLAGSTYPNPIIAPLVVTTGKIADANITTSKIADANVTDAKIATVSGAKVTGNIPGNAANVTGVVAITNGGTGAVTAPLARTNLGLGNVDNTSDLNKPISTATQAALNLKEDIGNKSTSVSLGTSNLLYPTQNAVKTYVDAQITTFTTPDATTSATGKVQLAGDLGGPGTVATAPVISNAAITSNKIADANVTDAKIATVSGAKVTGNIPGNAANVTGVVAVNHGGTGNSSLTANNVLLGNGTSAVQTVAPGASGNILTSNGSTWTSVAPSGGGGTVYSIGLHPELGGYVFDITPDGKHGMVVEMQDQDNNHLWYGADDIISIPSTHSPDGQKFRDWRLPTRWELNEIFTQRNAIGGLVHGTFNSTYWSSREEDNDNVWIQDFSGSTSVQFLGNKDGNSFPVIIRSVRAF